MSSDPQHFATTVLQAFRDAGLHTDQEIVDAGGPSTTTLTKLRKVAQGSEVMPEPRGDTLRKVDRAVHWQPGSARALWATKAAPVIIKSAAMRMAEVLGTSTPPQPRQPLKRYRIEGIESYVEDLADRVLELEERLDILEQQLSEPAPSLRNVAKPGGLEPEDGDLNVP